MARRTKLSEELIKEAYELVASGNYIKDVYPILGIGEVTWYRWLREGEIAKSGLKRQFWQAIKKAEKEAIIKNVAVIQKAAEEGNWQAAAWWLERRYYEDWGRKEKVDLAADKDGFKIVIEYVDAEKKPGGV
jgi:transposase